MTKLLYRYHHIKASVKARVKVGVNALKEEHLRSFFKHTRMTKMSTDTIITNSKNAITEVEMWELIDQCVIRIPQVFFKIFVLAMTKFLRLL